MFVGIENFLIFFFKGMRGGPFYYMRNLLVFEIIFLSFLLGAEIKPVRIYSLKNKCRFLKVDKLLEAQALDAKTNYIFCLNHFH